MEPPVEVTFPCPSCGKLVVMHMGELPAAAHPLPQCERFIRIETLDDATEYMHEARVKLGGDN